MVNPNAFFYTQDDTITQFNFIKTNSLPSGGVDVSLNQDSSVKAILDDTVVNVYFTADALKADSGTGSYDGWSELFNEFRALEEINGINKLYWNNVAVCADMFNECRNLKQLDTSKFNTSNVIKMGYMFHDCSNLTTLDVSKFNTSNVTNMASMFQGCNNLTTLDVSN